MNLGYCHTVHNDCVQEFCTSPAAAAGVSGMPGLRLECVDDDPACDHGAVIGDRTCTFHVALCFNVAETRVPCVSMGAVEEVQLNQPSPFNFKKKVDVDNRLALEGALASLGAQARGVCTNPGSHKGQYCTSGLECDSAPGRGDGKCSGRMGVFMGPLTASTRCTTFADIKVPLKQTRRGLRMVTYPIRVKVRAPKDPLTGKRPLADGDVLKLVCRPKP